MLWLNVYRTNRIQKKQHLKPACYTVLYRLQYAVVRRQTTNEKAMNILLYERHLQPRALKAGVCVFLLAGSLGNDDYVTW